MKPIVKAFVFSLVASILIINPAFAAIPNEEILDYYDQNGVYYYNPLGGDDACNSASTILSGDSIEEKIWNYFIKKGFNDAQTAGILGNAMVESGLEPTRASNSTYWGLFQWGYGRKDKLFAKLNSAGLGQYTSKEYWGSSSSKKIASADLDRVLATELDYTLSETDRHWQSEIKKQTTPEAAAEVFLTLFERAVNGKSQVLYYKPFVGQLYQGTKARRDYASKYYKKYSGRGVAATGTASAAEKGKNLTIIGDSITFYSNAAIRSKFTDLDHSNINAIVGRQWHEGIEVAKKLKLNDTVIFALGTNTIDLTKKKIENAIKAIGENRKIILVTNYTLKDKHAYDSNNKLLKDFAKKHSNIYLADWYAAISEKGSKYMADDLHPNAKGQKLFAEVLYKAVNGNLDANGCSVSDEFSALVKAYAWPEFHKAPYTNRMPEYAKAVTASVAEKRYVGGWARGVQGIDCGGFVTILVQNSGIAKNYNSYKGGTIAQERWVKNHSWTLLNKNKNTPVDTSILQPGDVAFSDGHTFIYVGEIEGFHSKIASASWGESSARAPMAGKEDLLYSKGAAVRWYRNPMYSSGSTTSYSTNTRNN